MTNSIVSGQALALGAIAGLRSMSAPAVATQQLLRRHSSAIAHSSFWWMDSPMLAVAFKIAAATEMAVDKWPKAPERTAPPLLAVRAASGALCGAVANTVVKKNPSLGALLGGAAAIVVTFLSLKARKELTGRGRLPDALVALAEDSVVVCAYLFLDRPARPSYFR